MGSKSAQTSNQATTQTSVAVERDNVMRDGQMISDSIIVDPSDKTMSELIDSQKAQFEMLMAGNKVSTEELYKFADGLLEMVNRDQVKMSDMGFQALSNAKDFLSQSLAQGKYIMDFASQATGQSYDLANRVVDSNSSAVDRAFSVLSDVKTGDYSTTLKSVAGMIMIFALGAIYLTRKGGK